MEASDKKKFSKQLKAVVSVVEDGEWRTIEQIGAKAGLRNWSSIASRLRDLKAYHGYDYEKRKTEISGVYEYRVFSIISGQMDFFQEGTNDKHTAANL